MIKQDLIQRVVERTGLPRTKAEAAVDAIFESMKQTLIAGDRIELRGFGVFTVKPRKTGIGRNPRTGAEVTIAPGKAVRFKPGKDLHLLPYTADFAPTLRAHSEQQEPPVSRPLCPLHQVHIIHIGHQASAWNPMRVREPLKPAQ